MKQAWEDMGEAAEKFGKAQRKVILKEFKKIFKSSKNKLENITINENMEGEKKMEKKYDVIILFSGGADSLLTLMLEKELKKNILAVIINYEQKHSDEIRYAEKILKENKIDYRIVDLLNLGINGTLVGSGKRGLYGDSVSVYYVPARNTMFLSIAASIAESNGTDEIIIGCDFSDREGLFKDCYQEYFIKVNELFSIAFSKPIKVVAPLLGWSKEKVKEYLKKVYNIDEENMYSGYHEHS